MEEVVASEFRIVETARDLARAAADVFFVACRVAIEERGRFVVALSGGNTPRSVHAEIAARAGMRDWSGVHVFWGDERCVPPDDPQSNYRMARETLLSKVPIPAENIHRWKTELDPERAAEEYAAELTSLFGNGIPEFDFVFLGLGPDGHTASLFPETSALTEMSRFAVANFVPKLSARRLTLTFPVFDAARRAVFVVEGEEKAVAFSEIRQGRQNLPASRIHAAETIWLADAAAAGKG